MVRITPTQGDFNASLDTVATKVRQPVFVDNAVHYAKTEPSSIGKSKVIIESDNAENYDTATEKSYSLVEAESSIYISHKESDGHTLKSTIWGSRGINSITPLLYGEDDPATRLIGSTTTTTSDGLKVDLRNMKGKKLKDYRFNDDAVRMGQTVDVGFRTTDLAIKVADSITGTMTSVSLGDPIGTANSSYRRKHSHTFLATDFNNVNLITALRYVSRHDSGIPMFNRYGSLLYVPMTYFSNIKILDDGMRMGSKQESPVSGNENRISVKGRAIAVNEELIVTMDDRAKQSGKSDHDVIEKITPVFDASVTSLQQARTVARKMLKANSTLNGKIVTSGHPHAWHMRPGDVVYYEGVKRMIIEAQHSAASGQSKFTFISSDSGLEGLLQGVLEGGISEASITNKNTTDQITEENFSFFNTFDVKILPLITVTKVSGNGFLIGRNGNRGNIGGNYKTIGLNKDNPVIIRGEL